LLVDKYQLRIRNMSLGYALPRWVRSTQEVVCDLVGDPLDQCRTCSQFDWASSLLDQVSETHDLETFAEASGHLD